MPRLELMMSRTRTASLALVLSVVLVARAQAEGDEGRGRTLFSRCVACHAVTAQNKVGPGLAGVVGRQAGTAPNFHYSKGMVDVGLTQWDVARALGQDQSYVSRIERCQRRLDLHEYAILCGFLSLDPGELLIPIARSVVRLRK